MKPKKPAALPLCLALLFCLTLALAACVPQAGSAAGQASLPGLLGDEPPAGAPQPQESQAVSRLEAVSAPAPQSLPNPEGLVDDLAEMLTPSQLTAYNNAAQAILGFQMSAGHFGNLYQWHRPYGEEYETREAENGHRILQQMTGDWGNWDTFYTAMTAIFTPALFEKLNNPADGWQVYVEMDGETWFSWGDRGSNIAHLYDQYQLVASTPDRIEFNIIGTYVDWDAATQAQLNQIWDETGLVYEGPTYTQSFPIVLEEYGGRWRAAEFHLTI